MGAIGPDRTTLLGRLHFGELGNNSAVARIQYNLVPARAPRNKRKVLFLMAQE